MATAPFFIPRSMVSERTRPEPVQHRPAAPRNQLLALLPENELQMLEDRSDVVDVASREIFWQPGEAITHVYFPEDAVISLVTQTRNRAGVEAMTIGSDGFAGLALFHGLRSMSLQACGQISGQARRLAAADFRALLKDCPTLVALLHRYSQLIFEIVSQTAACNRLHVIEQRCAKWLLMSQDRVGRARFDLTQEFLAEMLGVRRPGVTVAMGILRKLGLISHSRGHITVLDRAGLEGAACECYTVVRAEQERIFSAM